MTRNTITDFNITAGSASIDTTPPVGVELSGYVGRSGKSEGILDPLHSKALALESDTCSILIVSIDTVSIGIKFSYQIRKKLSCELGIPFENIIITATHTHSAPTPAMLRGCGELNRQWNRELSKKIVQISKEAFAHREPAAIKKGSFRYTMGYNRRTRYGFVDHQGGIISFYNLEARPIAHLLNFSCHPVILDESNLQISADYPGAACKFIEKNAGGVCLFLTGAAGDVDPTIRGSMQHMKKAGEELARSALESLGGSAVKENKKFESTKNTNEEEENLRLLCSYIEVPSCEILPVEEFQGLIHLREKLKKGELNHPLEEKIARTFIAWSKKVIPIKNRGIKRVVYNLNLRILKLGEHLIIFLPGEPLAKLGQNIKESIVKKSRQTLRQTREPRVISQPISPDDIWIVGYADDYLGYLPHREAYRRFSYEVNQAYRYYDLPAAPGEQLEDIVIKNIIDVLKL